MGIGLMTKFANRKVEIHPIVLTTPTTLSRERNNTIKIRNKRESQRRTKQKANNVTSRKNDKNYLTGRNNTNAIASHVHKMIPSQPPHHPMNAERDQARYPTNGKSGHTCDPST